LQEAKLIEAETSLSGTLAHDVRRLLEYNRALTARIEGQNARVGEVDQLLPESREPTRELQEQHEAQQYSVCELVLSDVHNLQEQLSNERRARTTAVSSVYAVTSSEIEAATNHFDVFNIVGRGGSACVYRGTMRGCLVAVKRLSPSAHMQNQFLRELQVRNATISEPW
jgi:hypothetical protein